MSIYVYIAVMALTTYLVRMLPLTLFQKEIKNRFLRSFLAFVPCACLSALSFPAILYATDRAAAGAAGLAAAVVLALRGKGLVTVAAVICVAVYLAEKLLPLVV